VRILGEARVPPRGSKAVSGGETQDALRSAPPGMEQPKKLA